MRFLLHKNAAACRLSEPYTTKIKKLTTKCSQFFCLTLTKKLSFPKQKTRFRNRAFFLFGKFAKEFLHFWRTWRSSFSSSPSCFPCWRSSYILYIMYREVYSEILSTVITSLTLQSKISQIFITYITILLRKSSARWLPPRSAILSNRTSVLLGVIKLDACTASIRMRSSGTSKCGPPHNTYSACRGSSRTVLRTRNH